MNTVTDTLKGSTLMTTGISSNFHFYFKQSVSSRKTAVWVSQLKVQCLQFAHKAVLYSKSCSIQQKVKHLLQTLWSTIPGMNQRSRERFQSQEKFWSSKILLISPGKYNIQTTFKNDSIFTPYDIGLLLPVIYGLCVSNQND